jgi:SRSO17 transposase
MRRWSNAAMLGKVAELVVPAIERRGPVEAWIMDDTGFPKKGRHSGNIAASSASRITVTWR